MLLYRRELDIPGQLSGSLEGILALREYALSTWCTGPGLGTGAPGAQDALHGPPGPVAEKDDKHAFVMQTGPRYRGSCTDAKENLGAALNRVLGVVRK